MNSNQTRENSSHQVGQGRLALTRLLWVAITILTLVLMVTSVPIFVRQIERTLDVRPLLEMDISLSTYIAYLTTLNLAVVLVHILIAGVIFWRRSYDWVAWLVSLTLVTNGAAHALTMMFEPTAAPTIWQELANVVVYIGLVSSFVVLYVFPDGRFVPRWTGVLGLTWALAALLAVFIPGSALSLTNWPLWTRIPLLLLWSGIGVIAQMYRYQKVSGPVQRQQTKWALLGLIAAAIGPIVILVSFGSTSVNNGIPNIVYQRMGAGFFTFSFLFRLLSLTLIRLGTLLFPISFAIAVLRYRLWDIDILLRRTLTYGILTATLLSLYLVVVVLSQLVLGLLIPQASPLAVVVSTLAIAALFNPLRHRIQNWIDRQFYRNKYDAEKTMEAFNESLREEVNLDQLSERMLAVVEQTMHPEYVNLCLLGMKDVSRSTLQKNE